MAQIRTPWRGAGKLSAWEAELAAGSDDKSVVWHARCPASEDRVTVDAASGEFRATLAGKEKLASGAIYYCRLRQQTDDGAWLQWSHWHQGFATGL
jgi:hypothetical protein